MALHIGKLIDDQIRQRGITKIALARRVKTSPQHLHGLIKRSSIDTDMLRKISVALNYNFFSHLSGGLKKGKPTSDPRVIQIREEITQAKQQIEVLARHNAYLRELLELHNVLNPGKKLQLPRTGAFTKRKISLYPINNNNQTKTTSKTTNKQVRRKA